MTLGTWQGIFIFEHRRATHNRQVDVAVVGHPRISFPKRALRGDFFSVVHEGG